VEDEDNHCPLGPWGRRAGRPAGFGPGAPRLTRRRGRAGPLPQPDSRQRAINWFLLLALSLSVSQRVRSQAMEGGARRRRAPCSAAPAPRVVNDRGVDGDAQVVAVVVLGAGRVAARAMAVDLRKEDDHDAVARIDPAAQPVQQRPAIHQIGNLHAQKGRRTPSAQDTQQRTCRGKEGRRH
jgi:hypothetical protein